MAGAGVEEEALAGAEVEALAGVADSGLGLEVDLAGNENGCKLK